MATIWDYVDSAGTTINRYIQNYFGYTQHATFAETYARSNGYTPGQTGAFAHAYVSAMITFEHSAFSAKAFGDAREDRTTYDYYFGEQPDYRTDSFRDLYNNAVGRAIGTYAKANNLTQSDIVDLVTQALQGALIVSIAINNPRPSHTTHRGLDPRQIRCVRALVDLQRLVLPIFASLLTSGRLRRLRGKAPQLIEPQSAQHRERNVAVRI